MTRIALATLLACMLAHPALAYVGPGPGLSMIGSFFTLVGGIVLALLMVLAYPIRLMLKRRKQNKDGSNSPASSKQE